MQPGKHRTSLGLTDVPVHLCQHQQTHTNAVHQALGLYTVLASLERQGERKREREMEGEKEGKKSLEEAAGLKENRKDFMEDERALMRT